MIKARLIAIALVGTFAGPAQADSIGAKGCLGGYNIVRPNGTMAHFCPQSSQIQGRQAQVRLIRRIQPRREEYQPGAERTKRTPPRSMGGHASIPGTIARQAPAPRPIRCLAEERKISNVHGMITMWFREVIYGDQRVLTARAAYRVRDKITAYIKYEISIARDKFAAAKRGEDADGFCANHLIAAKNEALRVFNIVKIEAANGNRDLEGTGLNPRPSVYNK